MKSVILILFALLFSAEDSLKINFKGFTKKLNLNVIPTNNPDNILSKTYLEEHDIDSSNLGVHEVWVETIVSALKIGTDRGNYEGAEQVPGAPDFPRWVGDSNLGVVKGVGRAVTKFSIGDRVVTRYPHQSEYIANDDEMIVRVPKGIHPEDAVYAHLYTLSALCYRKAFFSPGENVAIVGLGVLGLGAVGLGPCFGANTIGIANSPVRMEMAKKMGAHATFLSDDPDLKEKLDDKTSQIIYAKKGILTSSENLNFLILYYGKIINIQDDKTIALDFEETKFSLSKYTTKTTTWPKIQEQETSALIACIVNTLTQQKIMKENFYLRCNSNFYKEVVQELLKRIYLPIYLPLLSLVACFLIIKSKENQSYTKLKFLLFSIGIIIIIFSKLSIKFASINQLAFLIFLLIPCLIFYLTFNIFKARARKI